MIGPIILFPRAVFAWHVESPEKVDLDSLMIFGMIQPKVDSLIIGIGSEEATMNIGKTLLKFAHDYKINAEILPTELVSQNGLFSIRYDLCGCDFVFNTFYIVLYRHAHNIIY